MDYKEMYDLAKTYNIDALKQYDAETLAQFIVDVVKPKFGR